MLLWQSLTWTEQFQAAPMSSPMHALLFKQVGLLAPPLMLAYQIRGIWRANTAASLSSQNMMLQGICQGHFWTARPLPDCCKQVCRTMIAALNDVTAVS